MKNLIVVALALFAAGCGPNAGASSKAVGGQCTTDKDCNNRCVTDNAFGGGMCTVSCTSDKDCPNNSACITKDNNICAVTCTADSDCSSFGRGWVCDGESHVSGGSINVCRLP